MTTVYILQTRAKTIIICEQKSMHSTYCMEMTRFCVGGRDSQSRKARRRKKASHYMRGAFRYFDILFTDPKARYNNNSNP